MIIALFPNITKHHSILIASEIRQFLVDRGIKVVAEDEKAADIGAIPISTVDPNELDFMISLGGDGTLLRVFHRHIGIMAPLIGINLGGVGFMADIPINEIYTSLNDILEGRYSIQDRIMMEGISQQGETCLAVNEIVIHRANVPSLIELAIYVDGKYLNTFSADGIIVATPSGSTAYSLAAGGPILSSELEAFVVTPISPHTISNRPVVLMPKKEIRVQYQSSYGPVEAFYDGFSGTKISHDETFTIRRSERMFRLVNLFSHDYFETLRCKLGWTGKLKA